jgi:hypothetical protein
VKRWILPGLAIVLSLVLVLAFFYPQLMVSPGPLRPAHVELTTDCFACHVPLRGATSGRCVTCHAVADIGLRSTKGVAVAQPAVKTSFHQDLIEDNCIACHREHQGLQLDPRGHKAFSHELLRASSRDRCGSCHTAPDDELHRNLSVNCGQCHTQQRWKPATFEHDGFFVLDRDHKAACTTCHIDGDYGRYTCYGCHAHRQDAIRAEHLEEGIRDFEDCVECHRSASEEAGESGSHEKRERD